MESTASGQVTGSAAEVYDTFFVPALFGAWAGPVSEAAGLKPGDRVLDVACGTGALTREAWARVQPGGSAAGLDINDGMLAVARGRAPEIEWHQGPAESLPFGDSVYDAVLCQFGLMFFEDRVAALGEMARVLRPGGRLCVAVWDSLDNTPGYAAVTALLQRLFGDAVADGMRAPFNLGDSEPVAAALFGGGDRRCEPSNHARHRAVSLHRVLDPYRRQGLDTGRYDRRCTVRDTAGGGTARTRAVRAGRRQRAVRRPGPHRHRHQAMTGSGFRKMPIVPAATIRR